MRHSDNDLPHPKGIFWGFKREKKISRCLIPWGGSFALEMVLRRVCCHVSHVADGAVIRFPITVEELYRNLNPQLWPTQV